MPLLGQSFPEALLNSQFWFSSVHSRSFSELLLLLRRTLPAKSHGLLVVCQDAEGTLAMGRVSLPLPHVPLLQ
jgi:hypothetical protein